MNKADTFEFYRRLAETNPAPVTELEYGNHFQLLVAVVLSAQATDIGVNKATRALFESVKTPEQMVALGRELTEAKADWQIHAYGNAGHAFTDAALTRPAAPGVAYEERADRRSWKAMSDFLAELFV